MRGVSMSVRESNLRSAAPCAFLKDCFDFDSGTELLCFCEIQIIILSYDARHNGGKKTSHFKDLNSISYIFVYGQFKS